MNDEEMVNKLLNNNDIGIVITTGQEGLGIGCKGSVAEFICLFGIFVVKLHIMLGALMRSWVRC